MALITVAAYREPHVAHLARLRLEAEGIPAFVLNENHVRLNWLYSNALGGVRVQVLQSHAEAAQQVLAADLSGELPDTVALWSPPEASDCCPDCRSPAIERTPTERSTKAVSLGLVAVLGLPLPFAWRRGRWACKACGHAWTERSRYRTPVAVLGDAVALVLWLAGGLVQALRRTLRSVLTGGGSWGWRLSCWQCGARYEAEVRRCPECAIALPPPEAARELVVPGRRYDGVCPACNTPWRGEDYLPQAEEWRCSWCRRPLPRTGGAGGVPAPPD